jgi:uncharacterized protein YqeY
MLADQIKTRMFQALKSGNTVEKEILRVALGEIQTADARGGAGAGTDEATIAVLRKLVKSNEETLALATDEAQKQDLAQEIRVLQSLLPQSLTIEQIVEALAPVRDAVRAAPNDGAATGVAMKHLKSAGATVTGKEVTAAVKQLRA